MKSKFFYNNYHLGFLGLMLIMILTRFHHFGSAISLPDASLALFFLAGFWFKGRTTFILLAVEAGLIDYIAITNGGVSDFCISPAYIFLIPAYASIWLGGRLSSNYSHSGKARLVIHLLILCVSISLAFIISNGSFYLLSDKYPDTNWIEYINGFKQYYPPYLQYGMFYVVFIFGLKQTVQKMMIVNSNKTTSKSQNTL